MKFSEILAPGTLRIDAYDAEHFRIGGQVFAHAVLLLPDAPVRPWTLPTARTNAQPHPSRPRSGSISEDDLGGVDLHTWLAPLVDARPQVILVGTGATQILPPPSLLTVGADQGFGVEWMRTGAACRTFNLLASEGRRVAAGLLLERP